VVSVVLTALTVTVVAVPSAMKGVALTVLSGSMRPGIQPGDAVVVAGVGDPAEIAIGDVIAYLPYPNDPTLVTHRVTGISAIGDGGREFTTQGDANNSADAPVLDYQVRGKVMYTVPLIGRYTNWGQGHAKWVPAALGAGLLAYAAWLLVGSFRPVPVSGAGDADPTASLASRRGRVAPNES
jgi:signal peptidase